MVIKRTKDIKIGNRIKINAGGAVTKGDIMEIGVLRTTVMEVGDGDSEVIRNVVIAYLTEKGYLLKPKSHGKISLQTDQIASELDIHDAMMEAMAEILEEKGTFNHEEWERRVQKKLHAHSKKNE